MNYIFSTYFFLKKKKARNYVNTYLRVSQEFAVSPKHQGYKCSLIMVDLSSSPMLYVIEIVENRSSYVIHDWVETSHPSFEDVWFLERENHRHKLHNETCQPYPGGLSLTAK